MDPDFMVYVCAYVSACIDGGRGCGLAPPISHLAPTQWSHPPTSPVFLPACILIHHRPTPLSLCTLYPLGEGGRQRAGNVGKRKTNPSVTLIVPDTFKCGFTWCRCTFHINITFAHAVVKASSALWAWVWVCVCVCTCTLCMISACQT